MEASGVEREGFTRELWNAIAPTYNSIATHPFLRGITDGTLDTERFRFYILQDLVYLRDYARVLNLVGARAQDPRALVLFNEHSVGAIAAEEALLSDLLEVFHVTQAEADTTEASPTTLAYTSFLLRTATLCDYPEALGAVLPCYWIYWEVGKILRERGSPNPIYQKWIDAYAGEEFGSLVEAVLNLSDMACENLNASQRFRVRKAFVTSSRYEWMFWDAAWRLEEWPVE